jgi:hypothetical protein
MESSVGHHLQALSSYASLHRDGHRHKNNDGESAKLFKEILWQARDLSFSAAVTHSSCTKYTHHHMDPEIMVPVSEEEI